MQIIGDNAISQNVEGSKGVQDSSEMVVEEKILDSVIEASLYATTLNDVKN